MSFTNVVMPISWPFHLILALIQLRRLKLLKFSSVETICSQNQLIVKGGGNLSSESRIFTLQSRAITSPIDCPDPASRKRETSPFVAFTSLLLAPGTIISLTVVFITNADGLISFEIQTVLVYLLLLLPLLATFNKLNILATRGFRARKREKERERE